MRSTIVCLLMMPLVIGGCDRQSRGPEQANGPRIDTNVANAVAGQTPDEVTADEVTTDEATAPAAPAPAGGIDRSHKGTAEPSVAFTGPANRPVTLADFRGKPLLLNLWATWCAPCVAEMPTLDTLAGRADTPAKVIAVSQDLDGAAKVDPFFHAHGFTALQPYLDPKLALSLALKANLPTTILYDATGHEVWRMVGGYDWSSDKARALIAEAG